jgi:uncharacterized protein (DUF4415 family)
MTTKPKDRGGRRPLGAAPRHTIALRIDRTVLAALRAQAEARGIGYQTLIHDILTRSTAPVRSVLDAEAPPASG